MGVGEVVGVDCYGYFVGVCVGDDGLWVVVEVEYE